MIPVKRFVPRKLKESIQQSRREWIMREAVKETVRLRGVISQTLLKKFSNGWGDDGFRALDGYLREVVNHAATNDGPILEIGSGLTTIVMAAVTQHRSVDIWTLEHSAEFYAHTRRWLELLNLKVHLLHAPLRDYGEYEWYTPPLELMPKDFKLVVADGPPGDTKGGRHGLLPVIEERIRHAIILLDDADRPAERTTLSRWGKDFGLSCRIAGSNGKAWGICSFENGL